MPQPRPAVRSPPRPSSSPRGPPPPGRQDPHPSPSALRSPSSGPPARRCCQVPRALGPIPARPRSAVHSCGDRPPAGGKDPGRAAQGAGNRQGRAWPEVRRERAARPPTRPRVRTLAPPETRPEVGPRGLPLPEARSGCAGAWASPRSQSPGPLQVGFLLRRAVCTRVPRRGGDTRLGSEHEAPADLRSPAVGAVQPPRPRADAHAGDTELAAAGRLRSRHRRRTQVPACGERVQSHARTYQPHPAHT